MGLKDKIKKFMIKEGASPVPWKLLFILFILILFITMQYGMVFSYLPQLVKSFGISEVEAGRKAGMIGSSVFVGRVLFSLFWGFLADIKGKKFVMMLTATGMMLATLSFGFSTNFYMALVSRFLQGALGGAIVVAKATIFTSCDDTNSFVGMTVFNVAFSTGVTLGPSVGGFLAFPEEKFTTISQDSLFEKFSILLPNLVAVFGMCISILSLFFGMKNDKKTQRTDEKTCLLEMSDNKTNLTYGINNDVHIENEDVFLNYSIEDENLNEKSISTDRIKLIETKNVQLDVDKGDWKQMFTKERLKQSTFGQLLRNKVFLLACVLYASHSLVSIGYLEILPLYTATAKPYNGFGFTTTQIGILSMLQAALEGVLQIILVTPIASKISPIRLFSSSAVLLMLFMPMTPVTQYLIGNKYLFWFCTVTLAVLNRMFFVTCFTAVSCLLNNSVEFHQIGSANGLSMTIAAIGRAMAPSLFGSSLSWSLTNIKTNANNIHPLGFPFNEYFVFFLISIVSLINAIAVTRLPDTLNKKKVTLLRQSEELCQTDIGTEKETTNVIVSLYLQ